MTFGTPDPDDGVAAWKGDDGCPHSPARRCDRPSEIDREPRSLRCLEVGMRSLRGSDEADLACRIVPKAVLDDRALVADGRDLPDLSALLSGHERRRHRRSEGDRHGGSTIWRSSASTRSGSRPSTPRRWPISATTSPTIAMSIRASARSPISTTACASPCARAQGPARLRAQPHVRPASLVRREPLLARQSETRLVPLARSRARRRTTQQLDQRFRRLGLGVGRGYRPVLLPRLSEGAAGPQLAQSRGAARRCTT